MSDWNDRSNVSLNHQTKIVFFLYFFAFAFLCLFRPRALFYPPYWDGIMGTFTEGIWLLENKFNFIKLATQELPWHMGGPRVYLITFYSSFLAIMMKVFKNQHLFLFFNHLLILGLSSGTVVLFFKMLREDFGTRIALSMSALLFFHPMYLSQSYAFNMEIPILFFAILSIYYFLRKRFILAGVFSLIAFFIKSASLAIALSLVFLYILCFFTIRKRKHVWIVCFYSLPIGIYAVYLFLTSRFFLGHGLPQKITPIGGLFQILLYAVRWPDLFCLILLVPIGFLVLLIKYKRLSRTENNKSIQRKFLMLRDLLKKDRLTVISLVICAILLILLANYVSVLPRYLLLGLPFFFILVAQLILRHTKKYLFYLISGLVLVFFLLNLRGDIYQGYRDIWADVFKLRQLETIADYKFCNDGHILESTLGYEKEMELNLATAKFIEENYSDKKIISNWPISHMLWHPGYGYVKKNLFVIDIQKSSLFADKIFENIKIDDPEDYVWVYTKNIFSIGTPEVYDPQKDILLKKMMRGTHQILIFQRKP